MKLSFYTNTSNSYLKFLLSRSNTEGMYNILNINIVKYENKLDVDRQKLLSYYRLSAPKKLLKQYLKLVRQTPRTA